MISLLLLPNNTSRRSIIDSLDEQFRVATSAELEANNDHCAICWEGMDTARKLPCGMYSYCGTVADILIMLICQVY